MYEMDKSKRLRRNKEFQRVYRYGKCTVSKWAVVYVLTNQGDRPARMGFVTGKKLGCAVVRNRIRRLMKEVYRHQQDRLKPGRDIVMVGRGFLKEASYGEAEQHILKLWEKARILKEA